ncbi:hypothetical protein VP1G_07239 [Cytospora mali]|uniref:Uncharacterized protein n=1 Tax=Cytospora mali TaxID=578113 RepID=A0A194V7N1_CYTMA|nr:hypothetical protein VP1G_07239 [Valsa mali var. pyri (nom. inval.)]
MVDKQKHNSRKTLADDVHQFFRPVIGKTMRCDFCNDRNTSVLQECAECQIHICHKCITNNVLEGDSKHDLVPEDIDTLDWLVSPPAELVSYVEAQPKRKPGPLVVTSRPPYTLESPNSSSTPSGRNSSIGSQYPQHFFPRGIGPSVPGANNAAGGDASEALGHNRYHHIPSATTTHPDEATYGADFSHQQYSGYGQEGYSGTKYSAYPQEGVPNSGYGAYAYGGAPAPQYGAYANMGTARHYGFRQQHEVQGFGQNSVMHPQQQAAQAFGQHPAMRPQSTHGATSPNSDSSSNAHMQDPSRSEVRVQYGDAPQNGNVIEGPRRHVEMPAHHAAQAVPVVNPGSMHLQGSPHAAAPAQYSHAAQRSTEGFSQNSGMTSQHAQAVPVPNVSSGTQMQGYTFAHAAEQSGQHPQHATAAYDWIARQITEHTQAAVASNPGFDQQVGGFSDAEQFTPHQRAEAILEAQIAFAARMLNDRNAREAMLHKFAIQEAKKDHDRALAQQGLHVQTYSIQLPQGSALIQQSQQPQTSKPTAPVQPGVPSEDSAGRSHQPNESAAAAAAAAPMQDERARLIRMAGLATNQGGSSLNPEQQARDPNKAQGHDTLAAVARRRRACEPAAAGGAHTQEERPSLVADNHNSDADTNRSSRHPESRAHSPDVQLQATTKSAGGCANEQQQARPRRPLPGSRPPRQASSATGPSSSSANRPGRNKKKHDRQSSPSSAESTIHVRSGNSPIPGSEEIQDALTNNPLLAQVRQQEGEQSALDIARAANAMMAMGRDRSHIRHSPDGRRGLDGRNRPEIRANMEEIDRQWENAARQGGKKQQQEKKRLKK